MTVLVTTLRSLLAQADVHFESGRYTASRGAFEVLLERSQERSDQGMEVVARAMLAHCHLRRRDPDNAREQLQLAARQLDPEHVESHGRYRGVLARLAVEEESEEVAGYELLSYLRWAEDNQVWSHVVDACLLLAHRAEDEERLLWMQRGIDHALDHGIEKPLGRAYNDLAATLDERGRFEEAFEAYGQAFEWHSQHGSHRQVVASCWAIGVMACRLEDFSQARARLEEAVAGADDADDCGDLLALALADLALVYEEAGDVIEARRLLIRALRLARDQDLPQLWAARWLAMVRQAKRLELDDS